MSTSLPYRQSKKDAHSSQSARQSSSPTPPVSHPRADTNTTEAVQQHLGSGIPSSPVGADRCRLDRQQAVKQNLTHSPGSKSKLRYIGDDHECFNLDSVKRFCEDYEIKMDQNPWKNFKRLLSGCQDLPFILLQNPTNDHTYEYDTMKKCPTIQWISDVLTEIGLTLDDIVIVDICSLLSENDLKQLGNQDPQRRSDAMERSYEMVEDILKLLQPSVLVSCQCATRAWKRWGGRLVSTNNTLAKCLCSSESGANNGLTRPVRIGSHDSLMVYAVHPCRLIHEESMVPVLRGIFKDVFETCITWIEENRGKEHALDTEEGEESKEIGRKPVIAVKHEKLGLQKSPTVVVTEVDEDALGLGDQFAAMKIQEVNK